MRHDLDLMLMYSHPQPADLVRAVFGPNSIPTRGELFGLCIFALHILGEAMR